MTADPVSERREKTTNPWTFMLGFVTLGVLGFGVLALFLGGKLTLLGVAAALGLLYVVVKAVTWPRS